jgi:hypothetical protein
MLSEERKQQLAEQMGLSAPPKPRYHDIPLENSPTNLQRFMNFRKMVMLCNDTILTNSFWPYIPDCVVIDHMMDGTVYSGENCFATLIRTDIPPPVNDNITRATGIKPTMDFVNFLIWMGLVVKEHWTALRPRAMAPPLLCRGYGGKYYRRMPGAHPFLGIAMKFDLRPPDGQTVRDIRPQYGALVPMNMEERLKPENVFPTLAPGPSEPEAA